MVDLESSNPSSINRELAKEQIRFLLDHIQTDRQEQHQLAQWEEDQEFSILGTIELYTTEIRGYAYQILTGNQPDSSQDIQMHLRRLKLLEVSYIADWYFSAENSYPTLKRVVENLDYLRLLLLEYLAIDRSNLHAA